MTNKLRNCHEEKFNRTIVVKKNNNIKTVPLRPKKKTTKKTHIGNYTD